MVSCRGLTALRLHFEQTTGRHRQLLPSGASDGDFIEEVVVEELEEGDDAVEGDDEEVSLRGNSVHL